MQLSTTLRKQFSKWLSRRIPPQKEVTLTHRKIFIVPTRVGYAFILTTVAIFLAGVNYQNSMSFAVAFLLAGLFVVAIHHTYNNLAGLILRGVSSGKGHVGDDVPFYIEISTSSKMPRNAIHVGWPQGITQSVSLDKAESNKLSLYLPATERGIFKPGRLRVETVYPLGLLVAWSWVDLDLQSLVFPKPLPAKLPPGEELSGDGESMELVGVDDFSSIRDYLPGDAFNHVAWKQSSRHHKLFTKEFVSGSDRRLWLDWTPASNSRTSVELSISKLCYWCLMAEKQQEDYGLRIPGVEIRPERGDSHLTKCLTALALWQAH